MLLLLYFNCHSLCTVSSNTALNSRQAAASVNRCQTLPGMLQRGDTGDKNANAKQKWFEEKQKRKHAELERMGLDKSDMHRIETAEQVGFVTARNVCLCIAHICCVAACYNSHPSCSKNVLLASMDMQAL